MCRADSLAERASAAGDRVAELCGRSRGAASASPLEPKGAAEELSALVEQALPVFRGRRRRHGLYIAYSALAEVAAFRGQMGARWRPTSAPSPTLDRPATYRLESIAARAGCSLLGTTPVSELLVWLDENEPGAGRDHWLRAYQAGALAMLGRFDEARAILAEERAELAERGGGALLANITVFGRLGRALGRRSRRRSRVRSSRAQAVRGAGGAGLFCRLRPGTWRRRSTRLTGSTRPTPGQHARSSSARATTR